MSGAASVRLIVGKSIKTFEFMTHESAEMSLSLYNTERNWYVADFLYTSVFRL